MLMVLLPMTTDQQVNLHIKNVVNLYSLNFPEHSLKSQKNRVLMPGSHLFDASTTLNMHILKQWKLNRIDASNNARYQNFLIPCVVACVTSIKFLLF